MIVVDDHTLLAVLAGQATGIQPPITDPEIFTTSGWYYRLARAVRDPQFVGSLSRRLIDLSADARHAVSAGLEDLPTPSVGHVSNFTLS